MPTIPFTIIVVNTPPLQVFGVNISYEEILKEGKEKEIDLIVIASLGRTGIAKYLVGGMARNVLRGSKYTVLFTK
jgi:nucleotide-binding universal stress UspA family protein